jgi:CBS domain-containing protein
MVTRGIEGAYENGEIATGRLEVLSYNMPIRITIVVPAVESELILAKAGEMVTEGIVMVQDVQVMAHKTGGLLIPKHTRVRDIMTPAPKQVKLGTSLAEVARLLLSSTFTGVPVVDGENRPVGVISQGDLIYKAGMPMRLGLLAESDREKVSAILANLAPRQAQEVMTQPAVTIEQDKWVTDAVNLMLKKQVKRLPVIDADGRLVGILSRLDVFHTILRECPDWQAFQKQKIVVDLRVVADIMRRDTFTVLPDTPVEEVIRLIGCNDMQRVCVVNQEGFFLGLISDRDLLAAFSGRHPGIWDYLVSKISVAERDQQHTKLWEDLRSKTAGEVMNTNIVTISEDAPINEAIQLMLAKAIKRLPVVDAQGQFKGLVSRDELLRAGFATSSAKPA